MQYTINLDWLELGILGKFSDEQKTEEGVYKIYEYTFTERQGVKTKHFSKIYDVYFDNILIGDLCSNPHSSMLDADFKKFKFSNRFLYEKSPLDFIDLLLVNTSWTINNISRLDIAVDLQEFTNGLQVDDSFKSFYNGQIQRKGRACKWGFYGSGHKINGLKFGALTSERTCVIYNKTEELKTSNKQYITDYHKQTFSDLSRDVYRVEMRLKNKELKKLLNLETGEILFTDLMAALQPETLLEVFKKEFESYMQFVLPYEGKNITRAQTVPLIDFDNVKSSHLTRFSTKQPNKLYKARIAIKSLIEEYYISKSTDCLFQAKYYLDAYDLYAKVKKRISFWEREFRFIKELGYAYKDVETFLFPPTLPQSVSL